MKPSSSSSSSSNNMISTRRSSNGFSHPHHQNHPSLIPNNFISPDLKLQQSNLKLLPDVSFSAYLTPPPDHHHRHHHAEKRSISSPPPDDSELSIFDARKYFNEPNNIDDHPIILKTHKQNILAPRLSSTASSSANRDFRSRSILSYATPTASSEASWNSHTGLLSNPPGLISISLNGPPPPPPRTTAGSASPARWFVFRRKCPCSGNKSVQVIKKRPTEPRSPATSRKSSCRSKEEIVVQVAEDAASTIVGSERSNFTATTNSINPLLSNKMEDSVANSYTRISLTSTSSVKLKPFLSNAPLITGGGSAAATAGGFTFPLLNPLSPSSINKVLNTSILPHLSLSAAAPDDPPRDSLEVFQPSSSGGELIRKNSKDFNVKVLAYQADIDSRLVVPFDPASHRDDDVASDASSDLFEIESFSTNQSGSRYPHAAAATRHRDSLDEARPRFSSAGNNNINNNNNNNNNGSSGLNYYDSATEYGYEPSEASVAWTVTTADGTAYDQASLAGCSVSASDVEEFTRLQVRLHHQLSDQRVRERRGGGEGGGGSRQRDGGTSSGGILMSCRCEKAVSVGPDPVKCQPPPLRGGGGGGYFRGHVNGRAEGGNKPPLASSHAARLSVAFAT